MQVHASCQRNRPHCRPRLCGFVVYFLCRRFRHRPHYRNASQRLRNAHEESERTFPAQSTSHKSGGDGNQGDQSHERHTFTVALSVATTQPPPSSLTLTCKSRRRRCTAHTSARSHRRRITRRDWRHSPGPNTPCPTEDAEAMPPLLELPSSLRTLAPSNNNWGSSAADALAAVKLTAEGDRTNRKVPLTYA